MLIKGAEFLPRKGREKGSLLNTCFILPVSVMLGRVLCKLLDKILILKDEQGPLKKDENEKGVSVNSVCGFWVEAASSANSLWMK